MKIEPYYQDRLRLTALEEPYKTVLEVLNTLYMEAPEGGCVLGTNEVIDYFAMSCIRTIANSLTKNATSFPSILQRCKEYTYRHVTSGSMDFNNFYVNTYYEQTALFGGVYYVLAKQGQICQRYLDFLEKTFTKDEKLKGYFQPFKDALRNAPLDNTIQATATQTTDNGAEWKKQVKELEKENKQLKAILKEYTGEEQESVQKKYFTTDQIAIATYFLLGEEKIKVMDNQQSWANVVSKISRRNSQNIRTVFGKINTDMVQLKDDASVVAKALERVAPKIAEKIRNNFEL